jgi:hypothetical protein
VTYDSNERMFVVHREIMDSGCTKVDYDPDKEFNFDHTVPGNEGST